MVTITLSLPEDIKKKMDRFAWLNWSAIAREAFMKRMRQLEILEKFDKDFEKSKLSDEECVRLGRELRQAMSKHKEEK